MQRLPGGHVCIAVACMQLFRIINILHYTRHVQQLACPLHPQHGVEVRQLLLLGRLLARCLYLVSLFVIGTAVSCCMDLAEDC